ncbi:MAG: serine hydrolase [Acidobacteriota bacterium]|nr:serine hydrolase [Acidobacteriota bacterium]
MKNHRAGSALFLSALFLSGLCLPLAAQQRMITHVTRPGGDFTTTVLVENANSETGFIEVLPFGPDGRAFPAISLEPAPNAVTRLAAADLFSDLGEVSHFYITRADPGVSCSVAYLASSGKGSPVHLDESKVQSTDWTFYPGDWKTVYDGLAMVNTGETPTRVTLHQIHHQGYRLSTEVLAEDLAPGAKLLYVVGSHGQSKFLADTNTFFELRSDQPLALTALRGANRPPHLLWENPAGPGRRFREREPYRLLSVTPEEAGYSAAALEEVRGLIEQYTQASAVMLLHDGKVLFSWGDIDRNFYLHSIRKPMLNALYGFHAERGAIDLNATMGELGIDDIPPVLTEPEKQARVVHLLKSRSGVYHEAAGESQSMIDDRPERGSHAPDTYFYYNNWDFNALGSIFRQETGADIFEEFKTRVADRIGMEDFQIRNCDYFYNPDKSQHPVYRFKMSARDLARFGLLYMNNGILDGERIVSENWVHNSATPWTSVLKNDRIYAYGYLWEMIPTGTDFGRTMYHGGYGGHVLAVLPEHKLVYVYRTDTEQVTDNSAAFQSVLTALMAARDDVNCDNPDITVRDLEPVADMAAFGEAVEQFRQDMSIPGLSAGIVRDGELVWSGGFGDAEVGCRIEASPETCYSVGSLTKPVAAVVIMQLVEEGLLDLDTPVSNFGVPLDNAQNITVRHLLTHTSEGKPGSSFNYDGDRFAFLENVIQGATGRPFADLVTERIIDPLNMKHTLPMIYEQVWQLPNAQGYCLTGNSIVQYNYHFSPAAGLFSNVPDFARFAIALGKGDLLGPQTRKEMLTPMISNAGETLPYGLGWFIQEIEGEKVIWHGGTWEGASALMVLLPDQDLAFFIMANNQMLSWMMYPEGDVRYSPIARLFLESFVNRSTEE